MQVFLYCLAGATLLWFLNALYQDLSRDVSFPISFQYNTKKYISLRPLPSRVLLRVRGTGWNILKKYMEFGLNPNPIEYPLDNPLNVSYITASQLRPYINSEDLDELELENVLIDTIHIAMDHRQNRIVSIAVDSSRIPLAKNYRITSPIHLSPNKVALTGPQKIIEKLPDPIYIKLNTDQLAENYRARIPIRVPVDKPRLITKDEQLVSVNFDVAEYSMRKTNVVINLVNFPRDSNFYLNRNHRKTEVRFVIKKEDILRTRISDFRIVADYRTFRASDSTVALILKNKPRYVKAEDIHMRKRVKLDYEANE